MSEEDETWAYSKVKDDLINIKIRKEHLIKSINI